MSLNFPLFANTNSSNSYRFQVKLEGEPMDVSNFIVRFLIKDSSQADDETATVYDINHGLSITDPSVGKVQVTIPESEIGTVRTVKWWSLQVIDPNNSNNSVTALSGIFGINAS